MTRSLSKPSGPTFLFALGACAVVVLSGCVTSAGPMNAPLTLHAAEVVSVLSRTDIMSSGKGHALLTAGGIDDASIQDGSVVVVRLMCCGPPKVSDVVGLYNAKSLPIKVGDFVEFQWPGGSALNVATRVLQPAGENDGACWWDPKNEALWRRVVYCDWMPQEGWVRQDGLYTGWYKPVPGP